MRFIPSAVALAMALHAGAASAQSALQEQRRTSQSLIAQIEGGMPAPRAGADGNTVRIGQIGDGNALSVEQDGLRNLAGVRIVGNDTGGGADGETATVIQDGDDNVAGALVLGNANMLAIEQRGSGNAAVLFQQRGAFARGRNGAEIIQSSDGNTAVASQIATIAFAARDAPDNGLRIVQEGGGGNEAIGIQIGAANDGDIAQTGRLNVAVLEQFGELNASTIVQQGDGLVARSLQIGIATDPVVIRQTAGAPPVSVTRISGR